MRAASIVALVAALAPAALAAPAFTEPVASTICNAGQPCQITWKDDGNAPLLANFGDCTVGIYAGSQNQQSLIQDCGVTNAATATSTTCVPNAAAGEDSTAYFIKMISINTADPAMPQYKATAYSAMFTLKGMTGKFNETVQAQIAGTAPSSAGAAAPASTVVVTVTSTSAGASKAAAATSKTSTSAATTGTAAPAANGAASVAVGAGMFGATVLAALAAIF